MDYTNRSHEAVRWNIMAHIDIVIKMGYGGPERDESTFFSFFIFSFFFFFTPQDKFIVSSNTISG